jgi:hypothetical protein
MKEENKNKFNAFLNKAKAIIPSIGKIGSKALTGNYIGAIAEIGEVLKSEGAKNEEAKKLHEEFELQKIEFAFELQKLHLEDRQNARELFKVDDFLQKTFAISFLIVYVFLSFTLLYGFYKISIDKIVIENYIVGFVSSLHGGMSTKINTIIDFLFGSSQEKEQKKANEK